MDLMVFLDILIIVLLMLTIAGFIAAVMAISLIRDKKSVEQPEEEAPLVEPPKTLKVKPRSILTREELEELLFELEREKRTVTLGFSTMTDTHREVARARVQKIEGRLQHIRAQLAASA
jgi:flagellar basal body-associated protein FliL